MMPQPNDASVTYLGQVLGNHVINDILGSNLSTGADSHIFSRMMEVFNHLLLGGGLLIFAILLFIGTMNSAADGQFLGKKWDSTWTPVRLVFGILLVVPLSSGYCMGQYIILYAIFLGINLATVVWQSAINDVFNDQDTPPPPTFLTADIQGALAEALNSVAVPLIVDQSGLISNNAGNGNFQAMATQAIPMPNHQYAITPPSGSTTVSAMPAGVVNQIDLDAGVNVCSGLFSAEPYQASCKRAVSDVLSGSSVTGASNPSLDVNSGSIAFTSSAAIGLNVQTPTGDGSASDPWFTSYGPGMPQSPAWGSAAPDGMADVYGAYVIDTGRLSQATVASIICADNPSDPAQDGTMCDIGPTQSEAQGATDAITDLQVVVANAITTPGAKAAFSNASTGLLTTDSAQALMTSCNTQVQVDQLSTMKDPNATNTSGISQFGAMGLDGSNTSSGSVSVCGLQAAIQDIIGSAQVYAQAMALAAAPAEGDPNGSSPSCKSSSAPDANCGNASQAPQGQQEALADNTYKYSTTDSNGNTVWHLGYNLNDYWIADINSQQYFDLHLNNSWWIAGTSYLVVDNAMSQNMYWMAQAIQMELNVFSQEFSGAQGSTSSLNYQCPGPTATFNPDINGQDLTSFMTPEFCLQYGVQVMEYSNDNITNGSGKILAVPGDTASWTSPCGTYTKTMPDGQVVIYYSCALDTVRASQQVMRDIHYNHNDVGPAADWSSLIAPYAPSSGTSGPVGSVDTSATPYFYQQLENVPTALQGPISVLLLIAQHYGTADNKYAGYIKIYPYLVTLLNALQYNGALSQGPVQSSLPVNQSISFIFNQLIGGAGTIGANINNRNTSGFINNTASSSVNTVMQQVYNLGIVDTSKGLVATQFSLIQQAQTVGISMIMACMTSMEAVFSAYTSVLQSMVNNVNQLVANSNVGAVSTLNAMLGGIPLLGPMFGAMASLDQQQTDLQVMLTVTTTMTSISVQLMWMPLFMFIMTSLFVAGVQFAILVPLMPYVLFWGGEIAWLIGVLEAVVAGPLIMLGLAHPGGNEYLGHSAPAVRMLIGVMFRPVLMVIGLMTGIMLTYVLITFSAQGFHIVAAGILNAVPSSEANVQGIMACLLLFIYGTFLVMAFEKCFSPIYSFPEKVVEFIGGVAAKGGEADLQRVSQATDKSASGAAQAGGQTMEKGIQAKEQQGKGQTDMAAKKMDTTFGEGKAVADATQQEFSQVMEIAKMGMMG
jgi:conjugal transfer/type IV secretion protein DotA/TraY